MRFPLANQGGKCYNKKNPNPLHGDLLCYDKLPGLPHGAITPEEWQAIRAFLAENLGISL